MPDEKVREIGSPHFTIYSFSDDYVRPVLQVIYDDDQASKWFILNEDLKTYTEIDPDQLWFWTKAWQAKEREVDEDLRNGNYEEFDDMDSFIDSL